MRIQTWSINSMIMGSQRFRSVNLSGLQIDRVLRVVLEVVRQRTIFGNVTSQFESLHGFPDACGVFARLTAEKPSDKHDLKIFPIRHLFTGLSVCCMLPTTFVSIGNICRISRSRCRRFIRLGNLHSCYCIPRIWTEIRNVPCANAGFLTWLRL